MHKIVLLRHGESTWNKKGLFTGWTDVDLTKKGRDEARRAGKELLKNGFIFDIAYTSYLRRAAKTLDLSLAAMRQNKIEIITDWRLNERHYGNLQGLNKKEMAEKFGEKQVMLWRRGYSVRPPEIDKNNKYNQAKSLKYKNITVPKAESLKDVVGRVVPFWQEEILPRLKRREKIIIVASGNSIRALIKYLDKIPVGKIMELNIPTGIPLVYELNKNYKPIKSYYLADAKTIAAEIEKVRNQGKKN